jgi:urea transporter
MLRSPLARSSPLTSENVRDGLLGSGGVGVGIALPTRVLSKTSPEVQLQTDVPARIWYHGVRNQLLKLY